ncbi:TPA: hypothetical protein DEP21_03325 [Patescibacteria group bacterium]|nr:hypothetical protein [Candidatus Gracilibacteria bacterium]
MKSQIEQSPVMVNDVISGSLSTTMGIQSGDIIKTINSKSINAWNIETTLKNSIGGEISLYYTRNGVSHEAKGTCPEDNCTLGIIFSYSGFTKADFDQFSGDLIKFPLTTAMVVSLKEIKAQTVLTFNALGSLGKNLVSFDKTKIN